MGHGCPTDVERLLTDLARTSHEPCTLVERIPTVIPTVPAQLRTYLERTLNGHRTKSKQSLNRPQTNSKRTLGKAKWSRHSINAFPFFKISSNGYNDLQANVPGSKNGKEPANDVHYSVDYQPPDKNCEKNIFRTNFVKLFESVRILLDALRCIQMYHNAFEQNPASLSRSKHFPKIASSCETIAKFTSILQKCS